MPLVPPLTPADLRDGMSRLRQASVQAAELSLLLERGRSQMPLHEHFLSLGNAGDAVSLNVILFAFDGHSRAAALRWCFGAANPSPAGEEQWPPRHVEYLLGKGGANDSPEATNMIGARSKDAQEPFRLDVFASLEVHGIRVLLPGSPKQLAANPGRISQLLAQSNVLIVAGSAAAPVDEATGRALQELAAGVRVTWGIVCDSAPNPALGGWPTLLQGSSLVLIFLNPLGTLPSSPFDPAETPEGLRTCLAGFQQACRLEASLPMLEDRVMQDIRQQETRRKIFLRRSANLAEREMDRDSHQAFSVVRHTLEEGLDRLEGRLAENLRERTLPTSLCGNRINNLLEDLSADDLTEEITAHSAYLELSPDFQTKALRLLQELVRENLSADLRLLHDELKALCVSAGAASTEITGKPVSIHPTLPDVETAWDAYRKSIHLDFNYRAETPRRGVFDLIMHGRRPVIMLTMALSLVGAAFGAGHNLTTKFAPLLLLLFTGALGWAIFQFRQERQERVEKELDRLRKTMGPELKRLYEQVLRDWQGRATKQLREIQRELVRQLEEPLQAHATEWSKQNAKERTEIQEKLKALDGRLRDLAGLKQQFQRVRQAADEAWQMLERATRNALSLRGISGGT